MAIYVARSEWMYSESNEIIGYSENIETAIAEVIKWAKAAVKDFSIDFSETTDEEMREELLDQGCLCSKYAYTARADDWVCYYVDEVKEIGGNK